LFLEKNFITKEQRFSFPSDLYREWKVPLFQKPVKAKKTGDIEAIKAEIAEIIAAFSPFWA